MCDADAGRLWGRTLCGPVLLADPDTRDAVTSDGERVHIPENVGIANTSVHWKDRDWTMVMLPLPQDALARRVLLAHESFHRVQKDLGFPATGPANAHLDSARGRALLRMEWRALSRALTTGDKKAVADALAFRNERRALFKEAADEERQLEMHEGLAEHTGFALAEPRLPERAKAIARKLEQADKGASFVRSFAYASGPAWGTLIEMKDAKWTRHAKPSDDLGALAAKAWRVKTAKARDLYGAASIVAEEQETEKKKNELRAELRAKFVDGPTLTLPLRQMQLVFDPNGLQPLEGLGTVYRKIEISDAWGKIVVTNGGLVSSDWQRLVVPACGEGWTLTLKEGWTKKTGARDGDLVVDQSGDNAR